MTEMKARQNYWAILVAAIGCFLLEAVWYSVFMQQWVDGIGRTHEWQLAVQASPRLVFGQFATALFASAIMASGISRLVQLTGAQTARRGINVAAFLWLSFVLTTLATEYVFEVKLQLFAINAGFWFLGMALMGAIVGGWRKK
jgi:Protein of unknown function (DUF1761)